MTSKLWRTATAAVLVVAFGASLAFAAKDAKKEESNDKTQTFRPAPERDASGLDLNTDNSSTVSGSGTRGLGETRSASSIGAGTLIQRSFNDVQYPSNPMRRVANRGSSIVQFSFTGMAAAAANTETFAYNGYKPTGGGSWAQLPPGACNVQDGSGTTRGFAAQSDVNPEGYILMSGRDANGQGFDNRLYFQTAELDCFWGAGTKVAPSNYRQNYGSVANFLAEPHIEISLIGTDTVIHLVGSENVIGAQYGKPITSGARGETVVQYFRKVNGWGSTLDDTLNWSSAKTIDTAGTRPAIAAQRTGSKVAVIYAPITARGYTDSAGWSEPVFGAPNNTTLDLDMCYRESVDGGLTFGSQVNITNYGNRLVKTYGIRTEFSGMYSSDGALHVVFRGDPWPAGIYDSGQSFFFYDFSGSVLHWSTSAGAVTRAANADWGLAWNTNVCGFESGGYVNRPQISECDGNIYATWSQAHDIQNVADLNDTINNSFADCDNLPTGRVGSASAELWMSVSSDLTGLLWDKPRNLTNTYSRDCDSATGGGICFSEKSVSLAREGQQTTGSFTWPSDAKIDVTGTYAGTWFINALFFDDRIPGNAQTGANAALGEVKFARIACVDPVTAALISVNPTSDGYPNFVKHGQQKLITVTVTNDGNTALNITQIGTQITNGPVGVISTSAATLTVPAGVTNTNTFQIRINFGGTVNAPATVVPAYGYVFLKSNAANNDSLAIQINYVIADTVVLSEFDTVSTGLIRLAVSSNGAEGLSGIGGANLDYVTFGADCDATNSSTYLFSGGPMANRQVNPTTYVFTGSTFSDAIDEFTWKPIASALRGFSANATRERYSTGIMVSKDTTIGCERVWYAPLGGDPNNDFIIVCTKYWKLTAGSITALQFGDVHDFDIPSNPGAINIDGAESNFVWLRGAEATAGCAPYATRYGAAVPLGQYFTSQAACTNDDPYGQYTINNPNDLTLGAHGSNTGVIHPDTSWDRSGGFNAIGNVGPDSADMRIITTWKHNVTLNFGDTLYTYSALTTTQTGVPATPTGGLDRLKGNAAAACAWYQTNLRPTCTVCGCCVGVRGNVDGDGGESVDIADLTVLVDHLFISFTPLICETEGDMVIDASVDIGDLTFLVDHLFISFTPQPPC